MAFNAIMSSCQAFLSNGAPCQDGARTIVFAGHPITNVCGNHLAQSRQYLELYQKYSDVYQQRHAEDLLARRERLKKMV